MPKGKPLAGDRAVWDADGYPLLHTNDADAAADALHHTLGTGANQAAAGNHTHTSSQVGLGNVANILCKFDATAEPTANDDSGDGYAVGSSWFDVTNDKAYLCLDATVGAAVWQEVGGGGTDGTLASLSDVDIAGAANGERLTYNSTSEKWEPVAPTRIVSPSVTL